MQGIQHRPCYRRCAAAVLMVVVAAGCPELNRWSGPSQDPFFSVSDNLPPSEQTAPLIDELSQLAGEHGR